MAVTLSVVVETGGNSTDNSGDELRFANGGDLKYNIYNIYS